MRTYVPYKTNLDQITSFLNNHLHAYAKLIDISETAMAIVFDYFSVSNKTYKTYIQINGSKIYLNESANQPFIENNVLNFIAGVVNSSFWVWDSYASQILSHLNGVNYKQVPTDCYFTIDCNEEIIIYVPTVPEIQHLLKTNVVPEVTLFNCYKGGS